MKIFSLLLSLGFALNASASNQRAGQVIFSVQGPPTNIYRVCTPGCQFTTVQSAINQAATDGHVSNDSSAVIDVSPGTYTENVSLKPGISLTNAQGLGFATNTNGTGGLVSIVGNMDYTVSNGLTLVQNSITVSNINLAVSNGVALLFAGTSPARLTMSALTVAKLPGGDSNPVIQFTNNGGSQLRLQNNTTVSQGVTGVTAMDLQQGATEMKDRLSSVSNTSGGTIDSAVKLSNTASFLAILCQIWFNGAATKVVELVNTGTVFNSLYTQITNTLAGGHGVLYTAAGTARMRWTLISINANTAGYIGFGAAGTFVQGNNIIIGTNRQSQVTLTVNTDVGTVVPTP